MVGSKERGGQVQMEIRGIFFLENGNQGYRRPNWSDFDVELLDALCRG